MNHFRLTKIAAALAGLLTLAACAANPPTYALNAAERAIANAEQAHVAEYAAAELGEARQSLAAAHSAVEQKDMDRAQKLAEQSRDSAELASARASTARAHAREAAAARSDANYARTETDIARVQAESARTDALVAQGQADSARTDAIAARNQAVVARSDAGVARMQTEAARLQADELQQQIAELNARPTDRGLVVTLGDVLFESGRSDLKAGAASNLGRVAAFLNRYEDRTVAIEGHTDSVGSADYNLGLSQRRADSVRTYLLGQGVAASRLASSGMGEGSPLAGNESASGRQQNRRVEVIISNAVISLR